MFIYVFGIVLVDIYKQIKVLIYEFVSIEDKIGEFFLILDDGIVIDIKGWKGWEWIYGIGFYGIWKYYEMIVDEECFKIIEDWFVGWFKEGYKGKNINIMVVFLIFVYLYEKMCNLIYFFWLDVWVEWVYYDLLCSKYGGMDYVIYNFCNEGELWDDIFMMMVMLLVKIGLVLNCLYYVVEVKRQFFIYIQYLWDLQIGLFFYGWMFKDGGYNFVWVCWGCGNVWVIIVIFDFIEFLGFDKDDFIWVYFFNIFVV